MKRIISVFILLFSLSLAASDLKYSIIKKDKKFFLEADKISWEFSSQKRVPAIKKIQVLDATHDLIIYLAEEAGTQYTLQIYKALIVDHKNRKVITAEPLDYQEIKKESGEIEADSSFKIEDQKVIWTFDDEKTVIAL